MGPKFTLGETVGRKGYENYRGRIVGMEEDRIQTEYMMPLRVEAHTIGYVYTIECLCCGETRRLNEHTLLRVEGE